MSFNNGLTSMILKCKISLVFAIIIFLINGGCAPAPFKRTGSPRDFIGPEREATVLYGTPEIWVNIPLNKGSIGFGTAGAGLLFFGTPGILAAGTIGSAAEISHYRSINQGILDNLVNQGVIQYTQNSVVEIFTDDLTGINQLKKPINVLLPPSTTEALRLKERTYATATEFFAVDSLVSFVSMSPPYSGETEGIVTELVIRFHYFSSAPERKTVWEDVFICLLEPAPMSESLVEKEAHKARELIGTAMGRLRPWIKKELESTSYDEYPRVKITYKFGTFSGWINPRNLSNVEGWLLQDSNDIMVIRQARGIMMVLPRVYVKKITRIK